MGICLDAYNGKCGLKYLSTFHAAVYNMPTVGRARTTALRKVHLSLPTAKIERRLQKTIGP